MLREYRMSNEKAVQTSCRHVAHRALTLCFWIFASRIGEKQIWSSCLWPLGGTWCLAQGSRLRMNILSWTTEDTSGLSSYQRLTVQRVSLYVYPGSTKVVFYLQTIKSTLAGNLVLKRSWFLQTLFLPYMCIYGTWELHETASIPCAFTPSWFQTVCSG